MIQLVASDMDGTLLSDHLTISEENLQAITALQQKQIPFIICTGRDYEQALANLTPYHIKCPIIALNGSKTYDENGNLLECITIPSADAERFFAEAEKEAFHWEAVTNQGLHTNDLNQRKELLAQMQRRMHPTITDGELEKLAEKYHVLVSAKETPDYRTLIKDPTILIFKITLFHSKGQEAFKQIRQFLTDNMPDLIATSSNVDNIEINHIQAQKGLALQRFAQKHGIDMQHTLAIGDNGNDISMLRLVGYSYAVENAEESVKKIAKFVTTTNTQSGVAKAIKQHI